MLDKKYEVADSITIEAAQVLHDEYGIALVITDGKYVQLDKENTK